jgi:hypothetical protein
MSLAHMMKEIEGAVEDGIEMIEVFPAVGGCAQCVLFHASNSYNLNRGKAQNSASRGIIQPRRIGAACHSHDKSKVADLGSCDRRGA